MASRTISPAGGNWNTTAAWVEGIVPTSADDVVATASSGAISITATATCRSMDLIDYVSTLTFVGSVALQIGTSTPGPANVAMKLSAGMTFVTSPGGRIDFISTSTTVQTITTAGKSLVGWQIIGNGSRYQLTDSNTTSSTMQVTLTLGELDTNSQICSWGILNSSNASVRTLTMGASAITLTGSGVIQCNFLTITNLTVTANTATLTINGVNPRIDNGNLNWNGLSVVMTGTGIAHIPFGSPTFANLTRTGTAVKTDTMYFGANPTITGTLTFTGNSTTNRLLIYSDVVGAPRTITAAVVSLTNVDFMDITAAGAASPFTGTSLGNALGNTNITFSAPVSRYGVVAGNWSNTATWSATSGGAGGASVPLCHDDVFLDASSGAGAYTIDMPRFCANLDCSGFTRSLAMNVNASIFGSLIFSATMTVNNTSAVSMIWQGRGAHTVTSATKIMLGFSNTATQLTAPGGTYTLQDTAVFANQFRVLSGTLNTNSQTVTMNGSNGGLIDVGSSARGMTFGTSTINLGTGLSAFSVTATGMTMSAASATFVLGASTSNRNFAGAGFTYGTLTYTVANSPVSLNIIGANIFNTLNIGSGRILTMPASTTNTISSGGAFNLNGVNNGYLYLPGVASNHASAPDSTALSVTGDIDIRMRLALDDWTPAVIPLLLDKMTNSGQYAYDFYMTGSSTGLFIFRYSTTGTNLISAQSTTAPIIADGAALWIRTTRNATTGEVKFYTAADQVNMPSSWAQLGATVAGSAGSMFDGTDSLGVGANAGGVLPTTGKFYRAQIRNNILDDGTGIVFDANFTTKPFGANSFVESSTNAATVTINGTLAQAGDGRVSLVSSVTGTPGILSKSSGTVVCDYLSIQDSTATGGAAWYAGANSVNVSGNSGWIFGALGATATKAANFLPFFNA